MEITEEPETTRSKNGPVGGRWKKVLKYMDMNEKKEGKLGYMTPGIGVEAPYSV